jgi:NAD(P)-dependent dehydrogenase (short-subunit alcohol dehydrogenase family)
VLNEVASGIRAKGGEAVIAAADVTEEIDAAAVFAKAVKAYGRVDILVNANHCGRENFAVADILNVPNFAAAPCHSFSAATQVDL